MLVLLPKLASILLSEHVQKLHAPHFTYNLCCDRKGTRPCTLQPWQGRSRWSQSWLTTGPMSTLSPRWDSALLLLRWSQDTLRELYCETIAVSITDPSVNMCLCSYISVCWGFLSVYIRVRASVTVFLSLCCCACVSSAAVCVGRASSWDRRVSLHSTWLHKKTI